MHKIVQYLFESHFPKDVSNAVYSAARSLLEATNINKAYLVQQAGGDDKFKEARDKVRSNWDAQTMDQFVRNPNQAQKVLNFLMLMEIREPGFVDDDKLAAIHDLANQNSLEQRFLSKVNSDTTPSDAAEKLAGATEAATQAAKVYSDLTPEEERVWNRVKVYHTFDDGFKWIYAVDDEGKIIGYMPSSITYKTMKHCGNQPSNQAGNQYWELRGPDNRAYLTVILNSDDCIEESKSYGNQTNKYRQMIKPYVKWFLRDQKVKGVGHRYDYGYATDKNFGVKDFMDDDEEFVNEVVETKPALIGNNEKRILCLKQAIANGVTNSEELCRMYENGISMDHARPELRNFLMNNRFSPYGSEESRWSRYGTSDIFGSNGFEVLCGACSGCPYDESDIIRLASANKLDINEFANHDTKLLTDPVQVAFCRGNVSNYNTLVEIAKQVATFNVSPDIIRMFGESDDAEHRIMFYKYLADCNPKEKGEPFLRYIRPSDGRIMARIKNSRYVYESGTKLLMKVESRYPNIFGDGAERNVMRQIIADSVNSAVGAHVNEANRGDDWRVSGDVESFIETLSECSQEIIDEYSDCFPDDIAIRIMMLSEHGSLIKALGSLSGKNDKWNVSERYIRDTLSKLNARWQSYSRQTQSMLMKLFRYISGLSDKDKAFEYASIPIDYIYSRVIDRRNSTGPCQSTYSALLAMIGSTPKLFDHAMLTGDGLPESSGIEELSKRYSRPSYGEDKLVKDLITTNSINNEQLGDYIDVMMETNKYEDVVYGCTYAACMYNMDIGKYQDALVDMFVNKKCAAAKFNRMLMSGTLKIPMEMWDGIAEENGVAWMVTNLLSSLPVAERRESNVSDYALNLILGNPSTYDEAGKLWNIMFQVFGSKNGGITSRMRDRTMELIKSKGNVRPDIIESLVKYKVIRSADARKLINLDTSDVGNGEYNPERITLLTENFSRVEKKKRPALAKAIISMSVDYITRNTPTEGEYEPNPLSERAEANINTILEAILSNMGDSAYDDVCKYVIENYGAILGSMHEYRYSAERKMDNIRTIGDIMYNPRATLDDDGFDIVCQAMKMFYARPDWSFILHAADEFIRNNNDSRYGYGTSYRTRQIASAMNDLGVRAGRDVQLREVMPTLYHEITNDSGWYSLKRRYPKTAKLFGP